MSYKKWEKVNRVKGRDIKYFLETLSQRGIIHKYRKMFLSRDYTVYTNEYIKWDYEKGVFNTD